VFSINKNEALQQVEPTNQPRNTQPRTKTDIRKCGFIVQQAFDVPESRTDRTVTGSLYPLYSIKTGIVPKSYLVVDGLETTFLAGAKAEAPRAKEATIRVRRGAMVDVITSKQWFVALGRGKVLVVATSIVTLRRSLKQKIFSGNGWRFVIASGEKLSF